MSARNFAVVLATAVALEAHPAGRRSRARSSPKRSLRGSSPRRSSFATPAVKARWRGTGKFVTLAIEGIPAKPFRVLRGHHVMDFARVDIPETGAIRVEAAPLALGKGAPLVILDIALKGNRIHLLTHSAEPLRRAPAEGGVYGCTEFVFHVQPDLMKSGGVDAVLRRIETWLEWTPVNRICAQDEPRLCIEP